MNREVLLGGLRVVLLDHWPVSLICDHDAHTDQVVCSCSQVQLPICLTVGAAIDTWIDHVIERLDPWLPNRGNRLANREKLGQIVRKVWLEWTSEQPTTKPSWLLRWEELSESEREVNRRIGETLASIGLTTLTRERDEAREHRRILREWIDKDKTGLYAALTKVIKAVEARGWITEGRGPYEWDDDRYRQEAGWAFDEVRKIVVEAQKESDERMKKALAATEEKL